MWWTDRGYQVLRGDEWLLFRAGLDMLWDWVEESFDNPNTYRVEIAAFDELQPGQKLALLAQVGRALRDAEEPAPDLTAPVEAAVAAVFTVIRMGLATEVESPRSLEAEEPSTYWRELLGRACLEVRDRDVRTPDAPGPGQTEVHEEPDEAPDLHFDTWTPPGLDCRDPGEWDIMAQCLAERILWDDDYELAADFLDERPQVAKVKREFLGIAQDYFTAI